MESGFFPTYESNHIVLLMGDRLSKNTYLIDPSFHKYGKIKDLSEYQILGVQEVLSFAKKKSHDVSFRVGEAMPLFIKGDILVSFSVTPVDGKFDKNNFLFLVSVNRRNKIAGLNIVMVGKDNGKIESFEGRDFLEVLLNPQDIDTLHKRLDTWIKQI